MERPCVLGIDGGGSKTLALVAGVDGQVLGRGEAGPSNYQVIGLEAALSSLEAATEAALASAGRNLRDLGAACVGLAGVARPADHERLVAWAAHSLPGVPITIANDAQLVMAAGTPRGWGVALICGTGSIVMGSSPDGRTARAGGWGYLLGDEGSGYAIGLAALRAVMRAYDGRGPQTVLVDAVLGHTGLDDPAGLVARTYVPAAGARAAASAARPAQIAALAELVDAASLAGDGVAHDILQEAGRELALAVWAVVRRLELAGAVPCGLAGGVIVKGAALRAAFMEAATVLGCELAPLTLVSEPARGAIALALGLTAAWPRGPSSRPGDDLQVHEGPGPRPGEDEGGHEISD